MESRGFAEVQGLPWEPVLGPNHVEVKAYFLRKEQDEILPPPPREQKIHNLGG